MWVLQGNDILSGMKLVRRSTTHNVLVRALFKLDVV